jgi:hypothetical protein
MNNPSTIPAPQHPRKCLHSQRRISFLLLTSTYARRQPAVPTAPPLSAFKPGKEVLFYFAGAVVVVVVVVVEVELGGPLF